MPIKILFFGDVVGKIGRKALKKSLPQIKKKYKPDLTVINAENLAHGAGISPKTLDEMIEAGVDFFTSGNHIWDRKAAMDIFNDPAYRKAVIRPANYPPGVPGEEWQIVNMGSYQILMINLMGRIFMPEDFDCPFRKFDEIIKKAGKKANAVIVDFHAEATSEKVAFGWYADGRASAILGTHTHIPTADYTILPEGTAYITDVGMVGAKESVIGVKKEPILKTFLTQMKTSFDLPETGECKVEAVYLEINPKNEKAEKIKPIQEEIII